MRSSTSTRFIIPGESQASRKFWQLFSSGFGKSSVVVGLFNHASILYATGCRAEREKELTSAHGVLHLTYRPKNTPAPLARVMWRDRISLVLESWWKIRSRCHGDRAPRVSCECDRERDVVMADVPDITRSTDKDRAWVRRRQKYIYLILLSRAPGTLWKDVVGTPRRPNPLGGLSLESERIFAYALHMLHRCAAIRYNSLDGTFSLIARRR